MSSPPPPPPPPTLATRVPPQEWFHVNVHVVETFLPGGQGLKREFSVDVSVLDAPHSESVRSKEVNGVRVVYEPNANNLGMTIYAVIPPPALAPALTPAPALAPVPVAPLAVAADEQAALLLRLVHAMHCRVVLACTEPYCAKTKRLMYEHHPNCTKFDGTCTSDECYASKFVLAHYAACKSHRCAVCSPARAVLLGRGSG